MIYLKKFEFFAHSITKQLKKDILHFQKKLSPLMIAIIDRKMKDFNELVDKVNLEETDNDGNTALLIAASCGELKMLKKLIKNGSNIYHVNDNGNNIYDVANIENGDFVQKYNRKKVREYIEKTLPEIILSKKYNI